MGRLRFVIEKHDMQKMIKMSREYFYMNTCVECIVLQLCNTKTKHNIQKMIQISREYFM